MAADPDAGEPLEQLASLYADLGDVDALERTASNLRERFPDVPESAYYSATARFMHGDLDGALPLAARAVAQDPSSAAAHNLLGAVHASAGRSDEAARVFAAALALDPADAAIYINLGRLALSSGNTALSVERFSEALTIDPRSTAARDGLAQAAAALR